MGGNVFDPTDTKTATKTLAEIGHAEDATIVVLTAKKRKKETAKASHACPPPSPWPPRHPASSTFAC